MTEKAGEVIVRVEVLTSHRLPPATTAIATDYCLPLPLRPPNACVFVPLMPASPSPHYVFKPLARPDLTQLCSILTLTLTRRCPTLPQGLTRTQTLTLTRLRPSLPKVKSGREGERDAMSCHAMPQVKSGREGERDADKFGQVQGQHMWHGTVYGMALCMN